MHMNGEVGVVTMGGWALCVGDRSHCGDPGLNQPSHVGLTQGGPSGWASLATHSYTAVTSKKLPLSHQHNQIYTLCLGLFSC